jgi:hypothetical protein
MPSEEYTVHVGGAAQTSMSASVWERLDRTRVPSTRATLAAREYDDD